ncbi:MAG: tetratricopeptide repeat protein, partial [Alphaproteobacteria bacterium]|nr:tetratricopeptide repeat protein [Alphaproteobacteria bacterium]
MTIGLGEILAALALIVAALAYLHDRMVAKRDLPPDPVLQFRELPNDERISAFLEWRYELSTRLFGRDDAMAELEDWARNGERVAFRILTGPGGAGKSRLAAHVARGLKNDGWIAGFAESDRLPVVRRAGLFLILDYPEERRARTAALVRQALTVKSRAPIRLLLVSRKDREDWSDLIAQTHARGSWSTADLAVTALTAERTADLVEAVFDRLSTRLGRPRPSIDRPAILDWFETDRQHGLPLFATAAAMDAVLNGAVRLSLGRDAVIALAKRESDRLGNASVDIGLGPDALPRLAGFAALTGGLHERAVNALTDPALDTGLAARPGLLDTVRRAGWWRDDQFPAPAPDLLAVQMTLDVLDSAGDRRPKWLGRLLADLDDSGITRLGRLCHDAVTLHGAKEHRLGAWLEQAIATLPDAALRVLSSNDQLPWRLAKLGAKATASLLDRSIDDETRATLLNNRSVYLGDAGDGVGALAAIGEAVAIRRRLAAGNAARFEPDLASSLHNLSNELSASGDGAGALAAIGEAVAIRRRLAA